MFIFFIAKEYFCLQEEMNNKFKHIDLKIYLSVN